MTKIKLNWKFAKGYLDTDTLELICIKARGKRTFGPDEMDADLCIKDGANLAIAEIHLGDVESSNILCAEIARRWNEFNSMTNINSVWHDATEKPKLGELIIVEVYGKLMDYGEYEVGDIIHPKARWAYMKDLLPNKEE